MNSILSNEAVIRVQKVLNEFNDNIGQGSEQIDKMSDYQDQLNVRDETDTKR